MKRTERKFLKHYIKAFRGFGRKHKTTEDFLGNTKALTEISVQKLSRNEDKAFLMEISRILRVIMSIVEHPHLSTKREEIVARIEQVKQLSNEEFSRAIKESSFWKKRGIEMVPENVYSYQNVDELHIYENRFICLLLNLLEEEVREYSTFYLALLPTLDEKDNLAKTEEDVGEMIELIKGLAKRISIIKNTRFYKEISKLRPIGRNVQRTNILIRDNLYKQCFIFYRRFMATNEEKVLARDLSNYYSAIILETIAERGFVLTENKNLARTKKWNFKSPDFRIVFQKIAPTHFQLVVAHPKSKRVCKHLLILSTSLKGEEILLPEGDYESVDILSLWRVCNYEDRGNAPYVLPLKEKELVERWFLGKTAIIEGDYKIYSSFCPMCKSRVVEEDGEVWCKTCNGKYRFVGKKKESKIWFISRRGL